MRNDKSFPLFIYAIFDKKNNMYQPPFTEFSDVDAARRFDSLLNTPNTLISRFKDDFVLYMLGTLNLGTGEITPDNHIICDADGIFDII